MRLIAVHISKYIFIITLRCFFSDRKFAHYFIDCYLYFIADFCLRYEDDEAFYPGNTVALFCNIVYRYIIAFSDFYRSNFFLIFTQVLHILTLDYRQLGQT